MSFSPRVGAIYMHQNEKSFIVRVTKVGKDKWGDDAAMVKTIGRLAYPYNGWISLGVFQKYYLELKPEEQVNIKQHIILNGEINEGR